MLEGIKKIHFIGIGGVGMSAIAYVLLKRGFIVSYTSGKRKRRKTAKIWQRYRIFCPDFEKIVH